MVSANSCFLQISLCSRNHSLNNFLGVGPFLRNSVFARVQPAFHRGEVLRDTVFFGVRHSGFNIATTYLAFGSFSDNIDRLVHTLTLLNRDIENIIIAIYQVLHDRRAAHLLLQLIGTSLKSFTVSLFLVHVNKLAGIGNNVFFFERLRNLRGTLTLLNREAYRFAISRSRVVTIFEGVNIVTLHEDHPKHNKYHGKDAQSCCHDGVAATLTCA